jgi:hypothetical protein
MVVPLAHFGHWYISLPVYLGPVIAVSAFLALSDWRQRRRGRAVAKRPPDPRA